MRSGKKGHLDVDRSNLIAGSAIAAERLIEDHFTQDVGLDLFEDGENGRFVVYRRGLASSIF